MEKNVVLLDGNLNFLKFLKENGFITTLFSPHKFDYNSFSRYTDYHIYFPRTGYDLHILKKDSIDEKRIFLTINWIKKYSNKYNYLIAFSERWLYPLLKYKISLVGSPTFSSFIKLHDKTYIIKKQEYFKYIKIPKLYNLKNLKFPCVCRANLSTSSKYFFVIKNKVELKNAINIIKSARRKPIIQEFISGVPLVFNILVDKKSELKRILVIKYFKNGYNSIVKRLLKDIENFLKKIKYKGLCSPQFLINKNGAYLTEINPRLSGTPFGYDYEINFPEAFFKTFIENTKIKRKTKIVNFKNTFEIACEYLKKEREILPVVRRVQLELEAQLYKFYYRII